MSDIVGETTKHQQPYSRWQYNAISMFNSAWLTTECPIAIRLVSMALLWHLCWLAHGQLKRRFHWQFVAWLSGGAVAALVMGTIAAFIGGSLFDLMKGLAFAWWIAWVPGGAVGSWIANSRAASRSNSNAPAVSGCALHGTRSWRAPFSAEPTYGKTETVISTSMLILGLPGAIFVLGACLFLLVCLVSLVGAVIPKAM